MLPPDAIPPLADAHPAVALIAAPERRLPLPRDFAAKVASEFAIGAIREAIIHWEAGGGLKMGPHSRVMWLKNLRWWLRWCAEESRRGPERVHAWPVRVQDLERWLRSCDPSARRERTRAREISMATVRQRLWAIRHLHKAVKAHARPFFLSDPTSDEALQGRLSAWERGEERPSTADRKVENLPLPTRRRQRPALTMKHEQRIATYVHRQLEAWTQAEGTINEIRTRRLVRDWALLLVARDTMCRRSELAGFTWADWPDPGEPLRIQRSKTDPEGEGEWRQLSDATREALLQWRAYASDWNAPIFARIGAAGEVKSVPLTGHAIDAIIRRLAHRAGAERRRGALREFGAHSTRIGMAIDLARAGASVAEIMAEGRWKNVRTLSVYLESAGAEASAVVAMRRAIAAGDTVTEGKR
ncbi:MAG: tyrosine-type recombinase/integrase [Gemmatimonadaceae bacterium]|nr:tyrosine-type recombinase/integrase [Gemmatimonadaceae bacterium]